MSDLEWEDTVTTLEEGMVTKDNNNINTYIRHLEHLEHHKDTTCGLWATDRPELIPDNIKAMFFEIKYYPPKDNKM